MEGGIARLGPLEPLVVAPAIVLLSLTHRCLRLTADRLLGLTPERKVVEGVRVTVPASKRLGVQPVWRTSLKDLSKQNRSLTTFGNLSLE